MFVHFYYAHILFFVEYCIILCVDNAVTVYIKGLVFIRNIRVIIIRKADCGSVIPSDALKADRVASIETAL